MDVLKIAQNPLHLQTSEMLKPHVKRQDHCPEAGKEGPWSKAPPHNLGRAPSTPLQWWRQWAGSEFSGDG